MSIDNEVCRAWLVDALRRPRPEGRTKAVDYLEAVLEEVDFEMKDCIQVVTCRTEDSQTKRRGCLFWLLVSVLLSVTLAVLVNLVLFVLSGQPEKVGTDGTLAQGREPRPRVDMARLVTRGQGGTERGLAGDG